MKCALASDISEGENVPLPFCQFRFMIDVRSWWPREDQVQHKAWGLALKKLGRNMMFWDLGSLALGARFRI